MMKRFSAILIFTLFAGLQCGPAAEKPATASAERSWADIERAARGQTVRMTMWQGDPYINAYMRDYVAPTLASRYGINLQISSGQGAQIVTTLMTEAEAKKEKNSFDIGWINGETFYQLRQIQALHGPFLDQLPNAQYIDFDNRFIKYDFQQEVNGYEAPWGNVQLAIIYNSARVPNPPRTRAELAEWVKTHPGRFTIDSSFTGMTVLKGWMIDIAGGEPVLAGPFDEQKYATYSAKLWEYVNGIKAGFWKGGETFPTDVSQLHQMFAAGELDFTMSNNDGAVDNGVVQGVFPATSRAYVFDGGTIQNTHYLGIPKKAPSLEGALVTINFMLSPEAQVRKLRPEVWGDGTVLAIHRLPPEWQKQFAVVPLRRYGPQRAEIQPKALMELAPEYMIRLYEDFRTHVVQK